MTELSKFGNRIEDEEGCGWVSFLGNLAADVGKK